MSLFLRALILGYATAALAAVWLSESGMALWAASLVAWIGGNVLALAFAAIAALLWPEMPAMRSSFTAREDEFRLWDKDLARERLEIGSMPDRGTSTAAGVRGAA